MTNFKELRQSERFSLKKSDIKLDVFMKRGTEHRQVQLVDISLAGFRISTNDFSMIQTVDTFTLEVPSRDDLKNPPVHVQAQVCWARQDMGVFGGRFIDLTTEQVGSLEGLLKSMRDGGLL